MGTEWGTVDSKGKGKGKDLPSEGECRHDEWKVISSWEFNFSELMPLPDDVSKFHMFSYFLS